MLTHVLGYVKEQSLRGIIEWFDFWLSQWENDNETSLAGVLDRKIVLWILKTSSLSNMFLFWCWTEVMHPDGHKDIATFGGTNLKLSFRRQNSRSNKTHDWIQLTGMPSAISCIPRAMADIWKRWFATLAGYQSIPAASRGVIPTSENRGVESNLIQTRSADPFQGNPVETIESRK